MPAFNRASDSLYIAIKSGNYSQLDPEYSEDFENGLLILLTGYTYDYLETLNIRQRQAILIANSVKTRLENG